MKLLVIAVVFALCLLIMLPMVFMITGSFIGKVDHAAYSGRLIPAHPTFEAYAALASHPIVLWLFNSTFIAVAHTFLSLSLSIMVAFSLAKYYFTGKLVVVFAVAVSVLVPPFAMVIPSYVVIRALGLFDSLWAVVIPYLFTAGAIWYLTKYIKGIPDSLIDMALLDGLGATRILYHIIIPLSTPALAALACINLVGSYQLYLMPLLLLRSPEVKTLVVGVYEVLHTEFLANEKLYEGTPRIDLAGAVIATIPAAIFFFVGQKYFVKGLFNKTGGI